MNPEFCNEPVSVVAHMGGESEIMPQTIIWRDKQYYLTAVGRQWDETDGRHILVEAADSTRFELELRREDFTWRVRKVWWAASVA